jgi:hypothetical protein
MEALYNQAPYFFYQLSRNATDNIISNETRLPSISDTFQNRPQFQQVENISRNYARIGQQKFADPFVFHMKPNNFSFNGRKVAILDTLKFNAKRDKADVITVNPLRVVGFY